MALASGSLLTLRPQSSAQVSSLKGPVHLGPEHFSVSATVPCARSPCQRAGHGQAIVVKTVVAVTPVTKAKLGGPAGGAGVLERPGLDQSLPETAPRTQEGGEMGKASQSAKLGSGDRYRVLLLDHERHTESQVANVIPKVVPTVSPDEARKCFFASKEFGFGLVTVAVKEHAEFYVQMLVRNGLHSTMEEDRSVA